MSENTATGSSVTVADDVTLAMMMIARRIEDICTSPAGARLAGSLTGVVFALMTDRESITVTVGRQSFHLQTGVLPSARVAFQLDINRLGEPGYRPTVGKRGLWHPWLCRRISRLLAMPRPTWHRRAADFWAAGSGLPDMPRCLKVTCTDDQQSVTLGKGEPEAELIGQADELERVLAGRRVLFNEVMRGRLQIRASMQHLAGLSNAGLEFMLDPEWMKADADRAQATRQEANHGS